MTFMDLVVCPFKVKVIAEGEEFAITNSSRDDDDLADFSVQVASIIYRISSDVESAARAYYPLRGVGYVVFGTIVEDA